MVYRYGQLAVWGVAAITQFLAVFGIANELNLMTWFIGVGAIGGLSNMVYSAMLFMAYEKNHQASQDSANDETVVASAKESILSDALWWFALEAFHSVIFLEQGEAWFRANARAAWGDDREGERGEGERREDDRREGDRREGGDREGGERPPRPEGEEGGRPPRPEGEGERMPPSDDT